jgi:hypothetical protein
MAQAEGEEEESRLSLLLRQWSGELGMEDREASGLPSLSKPSVAFVCVAIRCQARPPWHCFN